MIDINIYNNIVEKLFGQEKRVIWCEIWYDMIQAILINFLGFPRESKRTSVKIYLYNINLQISEIFLFIIKYVFDVCLVKIFLYRFFLMKHCFTYIKSFAHQISKNNNG